MSSIDFSSHKLLEIFVQGLIKYDILIQQYIHKIYRPELNDEKDKALIFLAHLMGAEPNKQYMEDKCIQLCNFLITIIGQQVSKCQIHNHAPEYALVLGPRWWSKTEAKIRLLPIVIQSQVAPASAKNVKTLNFNMLIKNAIRVIESGGTLTDPEVVGELAQSLQISAHEILEQWKRVCDDVRQILVGQLVSGARAFTTATMDWAVGDFLLLHDLSFKLFKSEDLSDVEHIPILEELYKEVVAKNVEVALRSKKRGDIMEAWINVYTSYKYNCRNISLVYIQRQWHELKFEARSRMLAYCHAKIGTPAPHPLLASIVASFDYIVLEPFPSWSDLVRSNLVIQVTKPDVEHDSVYPPPVEAAISTPRNTGTVAAGSTSHATGNKADDKPNNATISSVDVINTIDPSKAKLKLIFESDTDSEVNSEVTMSALMFNEATDDAFDAISNDFARSKRQTDNNVIASNDKTDKEMITEIKKENTDDTAANDNLDVFETSNKPKTKTITNDLKRKKKHNTNKAILNDKIDSNDTNFNDMTKNKEQTTNDAILNDKMDANDTKSNDVVKNEGQSTNDAIVDGKMDANDTNSNDVVKNEGQSTNDAIVDDKVDAEMKKAPEKDNNLEAIDNSEDNSPIDRRVEENDVNTKSGDKNEVNVTSSGNLLKQSGDPKFLMITTVPLVRCDLTSAWKLHSRNNTIDVRKFDHPPSLHSKTKPKPQQLQGQQTPYKTAQSRDRDVPTEKSINSMSKSIKKRDKNQSLWSSLSKSFLDNDRNIQQLLMCRPVTVNLVRLPLSCEPDSRFGIRPVKKIELPDRDQVRKINSTILTAEVAPVAAQVQTQVCANASDGEAATTLEKNNNQKVASDHDTGPTDSNRDTTKVADEGHQMLDIYRIVESDCIISPTKPGAKNNLRQSKLNYRIIRVVRAPDCSKAEPRKRRQKRVTGTQSKKKRHAETVANDEGQNNVAVNCYDAKKYKRLGLWKKLRKDKKNVVKMMNDECSDKEPINFSSAYDEWLHQKSAALKYFQLPNMIPVDKDQPPQSERLPESVSTQAPGPPSKIRNTPQVITILNHKGVIVSGGYKANLKPRHRPEPTKDENIIVDLTENSDQQRIDGERPTAHQPVRESTSDPNVSPDNPLAAGTDPNDRQGSGNPQLILNGYRRPVLVPLPRSAASGLSGMPRVVSRGINQPVKVVSAPGFTTGSPGKGPLSSRPNITRPPMVPSQNLAHKVPSLAPKKPQATLLGLVNPQASLLAPMNSQATPLAPFNQQAPPLAPPRSMVVTAKGQSAPATSDSQKPFVHLGAIKNTAGSYLIILSNDPNGPSGSQPPAQVPENTHTPVYTLAGSASVPAVSPSVPESPALTADVSPSTVTNNPPPLRTYSKPKTPMKILRIDNSRPYLALSASLNVLVTTGDLKCERPTYWNLAPIKERIRVLFAAEKGGAEVFNPPTLHVNGNETEYGAPFAAWLKSVVQSPPAAPITEAEKTPCAPTTEEAKPAARIKVKSFARLVDDEIVRPTAPDRVCIQHRLYQKMSDRPLTYAEVITVLSDTANVQEMFKSKVPIYILTQSGHLVSTPDLYALNNPKAVVAQKTGNPDASKSPGSSADADKGPDFPNPADRTNPTSFQPNPADRTNPTSFQPNPADRTNPTLIQPNLADRIDPTSLQPMDTGPNNPAHRATNEDGVPSM